MLAIIQSKAVLADTPCPSAGHFCRFEYRDTMVLSGKRDRCGAARPARTNDGNGVAALAQFLTQVFQASQSLRMGVSEILCSST